MENVKFETCCHIIINFYKNHEAKPYTIAHFAQMNVTQHIVYNAIAGYESGDTHQKGAGLGGQKSRCMCRNGRSWRRWKTRMQLSTEQPPTRFIQLTPLQINSTSHFTIHISSIQVSSMIHIFLYHYKLPLTLLSCVFLVCARSLQTEFIA